MRMKPQPVSPEEISEFLLQEPLWRREGETLQARFVLDDFKSALAFVQKIGELAEAEDHHPEITIHWNQVLLSLTTHRIGKISGLDLKLAEGISRVFEGI